MRRETFGVRTAADGRRGQNDKKHEVGMRTMKLCRIAVLILLMLCLTLGASVCAAQSVTPDVTMSFSLISGASRVADNKYVWAAGAPNAGHQFAFQINYVINGMGAIPQGGVEILVPRHILKDSSGAFADTLETSVPTWEEACSDPDSIDSEMKLAYDFYTDEAGVEYIRLRNFEAAGEGTSSESLEGYAQIGYRTSKTTYEYMDYLAGSNDGYKFFANMTVKSANDPNYVFPAKPEITVYIDTNASISSTDKQYPALVKNWNDSWLPGGVSARPDWADSYWYLVWNVDSVIGSTQYFDFEILDKPQIVYNDSEESIDTAEVIAWRPSGASAYTLLNDGDGTTANLERQSQATNGHRYDSIITRIDKNSVKDLERWHVTNSITTTVKPIWHGDPVTRTSSRKYSYVKPTFSDPPGDFNGWKRADGAYHDGYERYKTIYYGTSGSSIFNNSTMRAGENSRYDLNDFQENDNMLTYDGFDYAVWVIGRPWGWTRVIDNDYITARQDGTLTQDDIDRVFKSKSATFEITDQKVVLFDVDNEATKNIELGAGDYAFTSLQLCFLAQTYEFNEDEQRLEWKANNEFTDEDKVYLQVISATNPDWSTEISLNDIDITLPYNIDLPADTVSYRLTTTNNHYLTSMGVVANLELKRSDNVMSIVNGAKQIGIKNTMNGSLTVDGNTVYIYGDNNGTEVGKSDIDFARVSQRVGSMEKKRLSGRNNTAKRRFELEWQLAMHDAIISGATGETEAVTQEGGTFYDLLPLGAMVDESTISIYDSGTGQYLSRNEYTVSERADFNGTGRTLLCIQIKTPGKEYICTLKTYHPWDQIKVYGPKVKNLSAYETGNSVVGNGLPDDGGPFKPEMVDLDPNSEGENRFLFATDPEYNINALYAAATGFSKTVRALEDIKFADSAMVKSGHDYVYRLRIATDSDSQYNQIIFVDNLETSKGAEEMAGKDGQWKGQLISVDVSALTEAGVVPVVYYSTEENATIGSFSVNFADPYLSTTWHQWNGTAEELENAKSIAVDARKGTDKDGNTVDFVLGQNDAVSVNLIMRAPNTLNVDDDSARPYPETYNKANLYGYLTRVDSDAADPSDRYAGPTTVKYMVVADVPMKKGGTDGTEAIPGITYSLTGTSFYGTQINMRETTDRNGMAVFRDVERSNTQGYTLQEFSSTPDWLLDTQTTYNVKIDSSGQLTINEVNTYTEDNPLMVRDAPRIHVDFSFTKMSRASEAAGTESQAVVGVRFLLTGESFYGNTVNESAVSDANGKVTFTDIERSKGAYELREISGNSQYILLDHALHVTVSDTGVVKITDPWADGTRENYLSAVDENGTTIYNEPKYWNFSFTKVDAARNTDDNRKGRTLTGGEFTLSGQTWDGVIITPIVVQAANDGTITFTNVEKGQYRLQETKAFKYVDSNGKTTKYVQDPTPYPLIIDAEGRVTCEILKQDPLGVFTGLIAENEPGTGKLTIYKKWVDRSDNAHRPDPQLTLWTTDTPPAGFGPTVTYVANGGYFIKGTTDSTHYAKNVVRYDSNGKVVSGTYLEPNPTAKWCKQWFKDPGLTEIFDMSTIPSLTGNITVYAGYETKTDFAFTGSVQEFTAPISGYYRMEAWGASGGNSCEQGKSVAPVTAFGAYTSGMLYLNAGETIYVYVGERGYDADTVNALTGKAWNGGTAGSWDGSGEGNTKESAAGGGGATDFRLVGGEWNNFESLKSRIMVAGAAGGQSYTKETPRDEGGYGGTVEDVGDTYWVSNKEICGHGATQNSGYAFGYGEDGNGHTSSSVGIGGGGGGYYGGFNGVGSGTAGGNTGTTTDTQKGELTGGHYTQSGNGGSSFISGYPGCIAIEESSTKDAIKHKTGSDANIHYSGKVFEEPVMISGNNVVNDGLPNYKTDKQQITEPDGTLRYGHAGDGYARITFLPLYGKTVPAAPNPGNTDGTDGNGTGSNSGDGN